MKDTERRTIEENCLFHLYTRDGLFFVDYYNSCIIHGYSTEAGAREAVYYQIGIPVTPKP